MPKSRSAKEICREDPDSISCSVATKREKRRKKRDEEYGEKKPDVTEAPKPEEEEEPPPKPATERQKYLDMLEKKYGT